MGIRMRYQLENEKFLVTVDSFGAEIRSVRRKEDDREYMWQADPAFWGRTSPVLFPFVGSVRDKKYCHEGKTYEMGQHGFARDMEFELEESGTDHILFSLKETEETMKKYPFRFKLSIGYVLEDNSVKVIWKVENPDDKELLFSIGAHPAFCCPIGGGDCKEGYKIHFGGVTDKIWHHGNTKSGMAIMENKELPLCDGTVSITKDFFDECTYMIEGRQCREVSLITPEDKAYVTVLFDTPLFALWSPEGKNAPFVCIEPWYGRCDAQDFSGELKDRDYEMKLEPFKSFDASYRMIFS